MDTIEIKIVLSPKQPWSEILIAELADLGFDGFVETDEGVLAYTSEAVESDQIIAQTSLKDAEGLDYTIEKTVIPYQNWNEKWESEFQPVYVEEYASILAPFHDSSEAKGMQVIIQPQMSFGTGHHQTTWMMTKALFELGQMPSSVLDMGTGTGVLAVVAENLGAQRVLAIDIEDWSAENAELNVNLNNGKHIEVKCGDIDLIGDETFGLIIANINKNVLKAHMEHYANALPTGGILLLSGFFGTDVPEMLEFCAPFDLTQEKLFAKDEWAAIQLIKK